MQALATPFVHVVPPVCPNLADLAVDETSPW
jgi:hypothetical protein